jgi:hypothetical protein
MHTVQRGFLCESKARLVRAALFVFGGILVSRNDAGRLPIQITAAILPVDGGATLIAV